eukprot:g3888.t1
MSVVKPSLGLLNRATTKILVCDIQERFRSIIHRMPRVIASTKLVCNVADILDIPVIVTEQYPKALKHTVSELKESLPQKSTVYEKKKFSMIIPEVEEELSMTRSVILCGVESHVCILQTALDLLSRGVDVHIVTDAVSSQRAEDRDVALSRLEKCGAFLTTSESVIFQLVGNADDENFKAISKLCVAKAKAQKESEEKSNM